MGLLADELIKTGLGNPKENVLSKIETMAQMIRENELPNNKLENVVKFSCERLNKMGYNYNIDKILKLIKP